MIQVTPQMRVLVAIAPVDFRCGIDGLMRICRAQLSQDPMSGIVFLFRSRRGTCVRLLVYDGQGFWLCHKRLSTGRFRFWPNAAGSTAALQAHELHVVLRGGDPAGTHAAPQWRRVDGSP